MGDEHPRGGSEQGSNERNPQGGSSEGAQQRGATGEAKRRIRELGAAIADGALDLAHSLITLLFILLHVVIDLGFIAGVAFAHSWFGHEVLHDFPPFQGLDKMSLLVLKWVFTGLLLYAVLVHVSRDAVNIWRRTWGRDSSRNQ